MEEQEPMEYPMHAAMADAGGITSENSLRYQTDVDDVIQELRKDLLAQQPFFDEKSNSVKFIDNPHGVKLINEKGFNVLCSILRPHLSRIFSMTDQEEEQARRMIISMGKKVIAVLFQHWDEFELKSHSSASSIVDIITNTAFANISRGIAGRYLSFLRHTSHTQEIRNTAAQQQNLQHNDMGMPQPRSIASRLFGR